MVIVEAYRFLVVRVNSEPDLKYLQPLRLVFSPLHKKFSRTFAAKHLFNRYCRNEQYPLNSRANKRQPQRDLSETSAKPPKER